MHAGIISPLLSIYVDNSNTDAAVPTVLGCFLLCGYILKTTLCGTETNDGNLYVVTLVHLPINNKFMTAAEYSVLDN